MAVKYDVLGIGNAIMDVIAPVSDSFLTENDIQKSAMTLIDENRALELHKKLQAASNPQEIAGGSAANTLVGIAGLGVRGAYVGKVANDPLGTRFSTGMTSAGVDFTTQPLLNQDATARCLIAVTEDGERSMNTFLGASVRFSPRDILKSQIQSAGIIYLEGYLFDQDEAKAAFVKASEIAQAAGRKVSLTLSDLFCVDRHRQSFKHLIKHHVDILFANESELLSLYETDDFDAAVTALRQDCKIACVTRSSKGSIVIEEDRVHPIPAIWVDDLIDTTGAGDQYAAGVLSGHVMGMDWAEAGYLGSVCAAEVIAHYGARPETCIHQLIVTG
ncbi:MAG: adenosine kinase [Hellea sp.]|nr:adenosine kinase [Hellea sp.]